MFFMQKNEYNHWKSKRKFIEKLDAKKVKSLMIFSIYQYFKKLFLKTLYIGKINSSAEKSSKFAEC